MSFLPRECVADIIDVFEDFLEDKGIVPTETFSDMDERKSVEGAAVIFGEDYDKLMNEISALLYLYGVMVPDIYGINNIKEWIEELKGRKNG